MHILLISYFLKYLFFTLLKNKSAFNMITLNKYFILCILLDPW